MIETGSSVARAVSKEIVKYVKIEATLKEL